MVEKKRDTFDAEISYFIGSRRFRDGYELRDVSFKGLRAEEALPPLDEIQRFNQVSIGFMFIFVILMCGQGCSNGPTPGHPLLCSCRLQCLLRPMSEQGSN